MLNNLLEKMTNTSISGGQATAVRELVASGRVSESKALKFLEDFEFGSLERRPCPVIRVYGAPGASRSGRVRRSPKEVY